MNNLYDKIYEAIDNGIQKALIITDDQTQDTSIIWNKYKISNEFIPYKYRFINLNLPSGLLWAEYNLGAEPGDIPEDWYGDYYAWGELNPKNDYSKETYTYDKKYKQLKSKNDVISITLGNKYRMPSEKDFKELFDNTVQKWINNYKGISGLNGIMAYI